MTGPPASLLWQSVNGDQPPARSDSPWSKQDRSAGHWPLPSTRFHSNMHSRLHSLTMCHSTACCASLPLHCRTAARLPRAALHSTAAHLPRARTPIRRHYGAACTALRWRCAALSQRTTSARCPATPLPHTFRAREPPSATGNTLRCHNPHSPPGPHCLNGSGIPFPSIGTLAAPLHRQWTAIWA